MYTIFETSKGVKAYVDQDDKKVYWLVESDEPRFCERFKTKESALTFLLEKKYKFVLTESGLRDWTKRKPKQKSS